MDKAQAAILKIAKVIVVSKISLTVTTDMLVKSNANSITRNLVASGKIEWDETRALQGLLVVFSLGRS